MEINTTLTTDDIRKSISQLQTEEGDDLSKVEWIVDHLLNAVEVLDERVKISETELADLKTRVVYE